MDRPAHWTSTYEMPDDMPPKGEQYPGRRRGLSILADIAALGVCTWENPKTGEVCGWVHTCCTGHSKTHGGAPCSRYRIPGLTVCRFHGGASASAKAKAAAQLARAEALSQVGELLADAELEVAGQDLGEQLVAAITQAGAMAKAYRWLLDQLPVESTWSWTEHNTATLTTDEGPVSVGQGTPTRWVNVQAPGLAGPDAKGQLVLHPYEEGLRYWTKLHADLLVQAAKLGLDERRQLLEEERVARIGDAFVMLVSGLGRDLDDPAVVPVVEAALRMVAGGDTAPAIEAAATEAAPASVLWGEGGA